jgi:hypothetical protein
MDERISISSILWRSILQKGHEFCHLYAVTVGYLLEGTAIFLQDGNPCLLSYSIYCDTLWQTLNASIEGWVGKEMVNKQIHVGGDKRWWLNEVEVQDLAGSIDLDLNFSPCTNLLPIRRIELQVGEKAAITAAWLKFPSFSLEPLPQQYQRLGESIYRYSSSNGQFVADLKVDSNGFVTDYPGIWVAESN